MSQVTNASKILLVTSGLSLAGGVTGILVAVHRKSGFWGGVGWFFLLGAAGTAVGYVAAAAILKDGTVDSSGPKQFLQSGAYIQGDSVYSSKGTLIAAGINQANSQGNVFFNDGKVLYANGDLFSSDDDLIYNVKGK